MKYIFSFLTLLSLATNAQTPLTFDKRFVQCEDKWVAFRPDKDSSCLYGFIYIDSQAGLTLNVEGTFQVLDNGAFVRKKMDSTSVKIRLQPNNVRVAVIPSDRFQELQIVRIPDWLKYYKTDSSSVARLYRWGFLYNGWDECAKALTYLERAAEQDPGFKGLAVELAFSYNCLKQYDKAKVLLEKEVQNDPKNAYVNKEYIYTLSKNGEIEKAALQFQTSVIILEDKQYNAENAFNILQFYYDKRDAKNFDKWLEIFEKQKSENESMVQYVKSMRLEMKKGRR